MKILIYGAGELSRALIDNFYNKNVLIDVVVRQKYKIDSKLKNTIKNIFVVKESFIEHKIKANDFYKIIFFTQSIFEPKLLIDEKNYEIENQYRVGLVEPVKITKNYLQTFKNKINRNIKIDICFIGSTSSYAGFKNTSIYCSVKHGLLGFVRSLNEEYSHKNLRAWLFSMGSMKTKMGLKVKRQNYDTFLDPYEVAKRIANTLLSSSNIFEPEQILRRRIIK
jgi:NAD(P)-dependent dehydrogenase (short-subunit alcohol dehydrogenase family)